MYYINSKGKDKSWCAKILGLDNKYGFKREFISKLFIDNEYKYCLETDGIYEVSVDNKKFYAVYNKKDNYVKSMTESCAKQWFVRRASVYISKEISLNENGLSKEAKFPVLILELTEKNNIFNSDFHIQVNGDASEDELELIFELSKIIKKRIIK